MTTAAEVATKNITTLTGSSSMAAAGHRAHPRGRPSNRQTRQLRNPGSLREETLAHSAGRALDRPGTDEDAVDLAGLPCPLPCLGMTTAASNSSTTLTVWALTVGGTNSSSYHQVPTLYTACCMKRRARMPQDGRGRPLASGSLQCHTASVAPQSNSSLQGCTVRLYGTVRSVRYGTVHTVSKGTVCWGSTVGQYGGKKQAFKLCNVANNHGIKY
eukprot:359948-Chlamydomonas_euryale.AAC.8